MREEHTLTLSPRHPGSTWTPTSKHSTPNQSPRAWMPGVLTTCQHTACIDCILHPNRPGTLAPWPGRKANKWQDQGITVWKVLYKAMLKYDTFFLQLQDQGDKNHSRCTLSTIKAIISWLLIQNLFCASKQDRKVQVMHMNLYLRIYFYYFFKEIQMEMLMHG